MKKPQHLSNDVLVRLLDAELTATDAAAAQAHVNLCAECRQKYHDLEGVSRSVESFTNGVSPKFSSSERDALAVILNTQIQSPALSHQKVLQRFAWGMALAASLALGVLLAPHFRHTDTNSAIAGDIRQSAALLQVDGETFVPLPYSNPDLPMAAHHIVEMQVPVASLADAGVHFEAISNEVSGKDDSVLADVLLGIDGQPLGVHVLTGQ